MEQANMMPNGMPPPNMNQMQRPQSGNLNQQLHAKVMDDLSRQPATGMGWQCTMDARERAAQIIQLISQLRILNPNIGACLNTAENFEHKTMVSSANKDMYLNTMKHKMQEVMQRRNQQAQQQNMTNGGMGMPNDNGMGGNAMGQMSGNMPTNNMGNNMGMVQNGMHGFGNMQMNGMGGMNMQNQGIGMPPNQMNLPNGGQQGQGFPAHLQRPMQPTPLPQQTGNTMDPSALQGSQMSQQMPPNMSAPQMQNANSRNPQQQGQGQGQGQAQGIDPEVLAQARQMMNNMNESRKQQLRNECLLKMNDQQRAQIRGKDPLFQMVIKQAHMQVQKRRANNAQQGQNVAQAGNNSGMSNRNPMQQSTGNTDFTNFQGQQANAIKMQQSGEQVVPASNNPNHPNHPNNPNNRNNAGGGQQQQNNGSQSVNPQLLGNQNVQQSGQQQQQQQRPQQPQQPVNQQMQAEMLMRAKQQQQEKQKQNQAAQQHAQALQLAHQQRQQQQQQQQQGQPLPQQQNRPNQLTGQPGGLNAQNTNMSGSAGQVNSPAQMPMLNRPMGPPGQQNPSTPQQNRGQGMPPTPSSNPTQLQAHFQQMMNAHHNGQPMPQGVPGQMQQGDAQNLINSMPPQFREKLATFTPEQVQGILHSMHMKQNRAMAQQQGAGMPGQGMPMGMPPGMNNAMSQPGQPGGMNNMQQNMANSVPDFNSQPPANQQMNGQNQNPSQNQSAQIQERMRQQQQIMIRQKAMDSRPFPKKMLSSLNISAPQNIQSWGDLKSHVLQNQSQMPPNTLDKLSQGQGQWFSHNKQELHTALQAVMAQHKAQQQQQQQQAQQHQGQGQGFGPPNTPMPGMPGGPAPTAPMGTPMQAPHNQGQGGAPMPPRGPNMNVSDQELQAFRHKFPQSGNQTDEQIRQYITESRRRAFLQQTQNQQQLAQQQAIRNAQLQQNKGAAPQMPRNGAQQSPGQRGPSQQSPGQQTGQKRPSTANDELVEIPNPNGQQETPQQAPPMQANRSGGYQMPTPDQMMHLPEAQRAELLQRMKNDNLRKVGGRPNASTKQPGQQMQPQAQQQQQQQQQQQAQKPAPNPNQAVKAKIESFERQIDQETPKGPPVQLDAQAMKQARPILGRMFEPAKRISTTYNFAMTAPFMSDESIKGAMRAALIFSQNVADKDGNIKGHLSINLEQILQYEKIILAYFGALSKFRAQVNANNAGSSAKPPTPAQAPAQQQVATAKPQDQKKAQGQEAGKKAQQGGQGKKSQNASNKAPPAPTDANKTFDWPERSVSSPHGVPNYSNSRKDELTPDKLKMPPGKRQKPNPEANSHAPTPVSQAGTPGIVAQSPLASGGIKGASPELMRKTPQQLKAEAEEQQNAKQKFKCRGDPFCQAYISGFETEEALRKHVEAEHKPHEDPLQYLLESAADALNVDAEGNPKAQVSVAKAPLQVKAKSSAAGALQNSVKREGLTPAIKQEALTPSAAAAGVSGSPATPSTSTISKLAGKTSTTPAASRRPMGENKAVSTAAEQHQPIEQAPKSLKDAMAEQMGFTLPSPPPNNTPTIHEPHSSLPALTGENDNNAAWQDLLSTHLDLGTELAGLDPTFAAQDFFPATNSDDFTWNLRPADLEPELTGGLLGDYSPPTESTPSSQGSSGSDVSESDRLFMALKWDPWGLGDTAVPEGLGGLDLGFDEVARSGDGDVRMGEAGDESGAAKAPGRLQEGKQEGKLGDAGRQRGELDWEMIFGSE